MLLPHYDWIAAPDDEPESTEQTGLNEIHAVRFHRFQMRLLQRFSGLERQVVDLLFGFTSGRPHTTWLRCRGELAW